MLKYAASPETVGVSSAGLNRFLDALAASSLELAQRRAAAPRTNCLGNVRQPL